MGRNSIFEGMPSSYLNIFASSTANPCIVYALYSGREDKSSNKPDFFALPLVVSLYKRLFISSTAEVEKLKNTVDASLSCISFSVFTPSRAALMIVWVFPVPADAFMILFITLRLLSGGAFH